MDINIGILLKKIREDVFSLSVRAFSELMNMHYTTYHNYEKNRLGRNPLVLIYEISHELSKIIFQDHIARSRIKNVILDIFMCTYIGDSQDYNYLFCSSMNSQKSIAQYINYFMMLAYNIETSEKMIVYDNQFHGQRRYCINKVVELCKPNNVLVFSNVEDYQLCIQMAYDSPQVDFDCILKECKENIEKIIYDKCLKLGTNNLTLFHNDINEYVKINKSVKFVLSMYHIHHIQKDSDKINFLKTLYELIPRKGYLCISEPFLDEDNNKFKNRWSLVKEETYAKKFWMSLNDIDKKSIEYSKIYAEKAKEAERTMGENYINGNDEYLVTFEWMENICTEIGFNIILSERTNCFSDAIILLEKS
ncbi:MAG: hypothetical protein ABF289_09025 [Clostridiales bacterium]